MKIFILEDNLDRIKAFKQNLIGHELFIASDVEIAKTMLKFNQFEFIFLDHDLGGEVYVNSEFPNTGYQLAKWIKDNNITYKRLYVHSCNPVGAMNIKSLIPEAELIPFPNLF